MKKPSVKTNNYFRKFSLFRKLVALISLRQDPPLDLGFWSFLTFLHRGIEEVERHLLWKFHKNFKGKVGQMCHRTKVARLHKVSIQSCTQKRLSPKVQSLSRGWITFLPLGLSLWNLAHLFIMFMAPKLASDFLIFVQGLSYGLSKLKKRGKIITKLWKIITKSLGKN